MSAGLTSDYTGAVPHPHLHHKDILYSAFIDDILSLIVI